MAKNKHTEPDTTKAPVLVAPTTEARVDARRVTFAWEPAPEGSELILQVAQDSGFETLVVDRDVSGETSVTLEDAFPTVGDTYYWRLLVDDGDGRQHGVDHIESFVATDETQAAMHSDHENRDDEEYGPVGELMKGAATEAAAEVTHDETYLRKEAEMGVAHEGVASGQIIGLAAAVLLAVALCVVVLFVYTDVTVQSVRYGVAGMSGYPEVQQIRQVGEERLGGYDVIDSEANVYQIPIDRAMDLMIQEAGDQAAGSAAPEAQFLPGRTDQPAGAAQPAQGPAGPADAEQEEAGEENVDQESPGQDGTAQ